MVALVSAIPQLKPPVCSARTSISSARSPFFTVSRLIRCATARNGLQAERPHTGRTLNENASRLDAVSELSADLKLGMCSPCEHR